MSHKTSIRLGLAGYGNLGRGLERAVAANPDLELKVILTKRDPTTIKSPYGTPADRFGNAANWRGQLDVVVLCGGSATDLPEQGPVLASLFNTVDSFDNHGKIPDYFAEIDRVARENRHLSLISCGWDPGLFSLSRVLFSSILPQGLDYTFWGKGISQGHSDALRRIPGVVDARQYTIPLEEALAIARSDLGRPLSPREKHRRECFVVAEPDADLAAIEEAIVNMPGYFADYDTRVHFISQSELHEKHNRLPHGGFVIRNAKTSENTGQVMEFSLKLDSNPEFTASVLAAYARAVFRMAQKGHVGAISVFDIPCGELSRFSPEELRRDFL
ncbi:MAG: diaminopimelate dehydrogenase [Saccharofermentanales bacterium]|nr:diaminopimelate dehydrogenase [Clostridiaceae bacterium]